MMLLTHTLGASAQFILVPLLLGVLFLGVALFAHFSERARRLRCTKTALATVIDFDIRETSDRHDYIGGNISYFPILRFYIDTYEYIVTSNSGSRPPAYNVGEQLYIHYNNEDPYDFYIDNNTAPVFLCVVFEAVGVLLLGIAVCAALNLV